jgi:peptide/nickel transport system permease protein
MASPVGTLDVIARRAERAPLATRMWKGSISFMRRKPLGAAGAVIILVMVILALAAPLIAGDPTAWSLRENFQGSSWKYWLGTNDVGQDLWAQIVNGARISLYVGILSVAFGSGSGGLIGLMSAATVGRWTLLSSA